MCGGNSHDATIISDNDCQSVKAESICIKCYLKLILSDVSYNLDYRNGEAYS